MERKAREMSEESEVCFLVAYWQASFSCLCLQIQKARWMERRETEWLELRESLESRHAEAVATLHSQIEEMDRLQTYSAYTFMIYVSLFVRSCIESVSTPLVVRIPLARCHSYSILRLVPLKMVQVRKLIRSFSVTAKSSRD